jgi:hypothetical protein
VCRPPALAYFNDDIKTFSADLTRLVPNKKTTSLLDDNIVTQAVKEDDNDMSTEDQVKPTTNGVAKQALDKGYSVASTTGATTESSEDDKNAWSQNQQKLFEKALGSVPKDVPDRWTQIARNVPGKTKVSVFFCTRSF